MGTTSKTCLTKRHQSSTPSTFQDDEILSALSLSGYKRPTINWYPGHIAKAEKMLSETLSAVDVVIEVRDARAPKATAHPRVGEWTAGKPRIVVLTKSDLVPSKARSAWKTAYETFGAANWDAADFDGYGNAKNRAQQAASERRKYGNDSNNSNIVGISSVEQVVFVNAKEGRGVRGIHRAVLAAGSHVNERRRKRGLADRPLRVGVIGYPNVGKSAVINRILGRKRARSADTPGITRTLQWIRVGTRGTSSPTTNASGSSTQGSSGSGKKRTDFELLDSPGIIPANVLDQNDALLLAACNCIGTNAYDNQGVASFLFEWIKTLHTLGRGDVTCPQWRDKCLERYKFDPLAPLEDNTNDDDQSERIMSGEDMLYKIAADTCQNNAEDAARKMLQDFRAGRLGPVSLQLAPEKPTDKGQTAVDMSGSTYSVTALAERLRVAGELSKQRALEEKQRKGKMALETALERGIALPPGYEPGTQEEDEGGQVDTPSKSGRTTSPSLDDVGRGQFDGW